MWWLIALLLCGSIFDIVIKTVSAPSPNDDISNGTRGRRGLKPCLRLKWGMATFC